MPAVLRVFCLDGHYLSSLMLLLGPLYLKHYSGRINMPKLVLLLWWDSSRENL